MASFGVSLVDAAAGVLLNATAPAAAGGQQHVAVHPVARVSAGAMNAVYIAGNCLSILALVTPLFTYVYPVWRSQVVGARTIKNFLFVFGSALLCLLFAIPLKLTSRFVIVVNGVRVALQIIYLVGDNRTYSSRLVLIAAAIAFVVLIILVPLALLTDIWSVKVVGISASTFATINFAGGLLDVATLVREQRSGFNHFQLLVNLLGACTWAAYGFLFKPVNLYPVIPNLMAVLVVTIQIYFHAAQKRKERNQQPVGNRPSSA